MIVDFSSRIFFLQINKILFLERNENLFFQKR